MQEADIQKMSAAEREDAVNEIRLLASIRHENICRYHEAFVDGNYLCIVMEFAPNGDLGRFIRKGQEFRKVTCHQMTSMTSSDGTSASVSRAKHLNIVRATASAPARTAGLSGGPDLEVPYRCHVRHATWSCC